MDFFTNLSLNFNKLLYHRENQMARLFAVALKNRSLKEKNWKSFEDMVTEMADNDHNFSYV